MKNLEKIGCGTALVTPFLKGGEIDFSTLKRLVSFQIEGGINFLVPCGTTGENATLSAEEHLKVVETVVTTADGKVPVIAGAGGYNTSTVIKMAKAVEKCGADGILSVTPYYNKPTQEGLFQHYRALAGEVGLPIILYNVPGRTGTNLLPETVIRLSEIDNIVAIKEASGNVDQISELSVKVPKGFMILSGDDANTLPMIAMGASGVISVVANQVPGMMVALAQACLRGKFDKARSLQAQLYDLMKEKVIGW